MHAVGPRAAELTLNQKAAVTQRRETRTHVCLQVKAIQNTFAKWWCVCLAVDNFIGAVPSSLVMCHEIVVWSSFFDG